MSYQFQVPKEELLSPGHLACSGCGAALAMRLILKVTGEKTVVVVPACCWSVIDGAFPSSATKVPLYHTAFCAAPATAAGIRAALDLKGDHESTVMIMAGDGGTFDIGFASLSGMVERNDNILYICYDNEGYMNTGIQRSSATPKGAWTTTTPVVHPEENPKKDLVGIMAAHKIPYAATASVAYPDDLIRKVKTASTVKGSRLLHVFSPCPPGWKLPPSKMIQIARMAVASGLFPLYEVYRGRDWRMSEGYDGTQVGEVLKLQGRFSHLEPEEIQRMQELVDEGMSELAGRVKKSSASQFFK
ncbi:thiamine pyrophosphate-dependent enzyme [candidate division KSB1 bacterium]